MSSECSESPPVEQRTASRLSLLVSSHSDPALSGVRGLYLELKSDNHRLPLQHHSSTTCRKKEYIPFSLSRYYKQIMKTNMQCINTWIDNLLKFQTALFVLVQHSMEFSVSPSLFVKHRVQETKIPTKFHVIVKWQVVLKWSIA